MSTSSSDYEGYRNICKRAAEDADTFSTFKTNGDYNKVLEHVNVEEGLMYSKKVLSLKQLSESDIQKAKENDEQGTPKTEKYDEPFGVIAPSTIRYMSVMSELMAHVGDLNGFVIVEVGGGYGGQCKLILDKFDVKEYHIYDLPEPLALTKKYHEKYGYTKVIYHDVLQSIDPVPHIDLFLSNYAFSELRQEFQEIYLSQFIDKATHAHIVCNWINGSLPKTELLSRLSKAKCEPEIPPWTETFYW